MPPRNPHEAPSPGVTVLGEGTCGRRSGLGEVTRVGLQDETSALVKVDTGCLSPHQVRAGKARRRPLQATESPAGPERAVPCLAARSAAGRSRCVQVARVPQVTAAAAETWRALDSGVRAPWSCLSREGGPARAGHRAAWALSASGDGTGQGREPSRSLCRSWGRDRRGVGPARGRGAPRTSAR